MLIFMVKELWAKNIKVEDKDKTHWAKIRIIKDKGKNYIDVLIGRREKNHPHTHFKLNLDQSDIFLGSRGVTHSIQREIISKNRGLLENKKVIIDQKAEANKKFNFSFNMDGKTREVKLTKFELV